MVSYQGEVSLRLMTSQREDFYDTFFSKLAKMCETGTFPINAGLSLQD